MTKLKDVFVELIHLPISEQKQFVAEIKQEILKEKILKNSPVLPSYNMLSDTEKIGFYLILIEYLFNNPTGKTLL